MKRKSRVKNLKKQAILFTVILLVIVFGVIYLWWMGNSKPVSDSSEKYLFELKPGMSAAQIADQLEQKKIIRDADYFRYLCKINNADSKLVAGEYYLSPSMNPKEILQSFLKGPDPDIIRVTIPEGYTVEQIVDLFVENGLGSQEDFYKEMRSFNLSDYKFLKDIPEGNNRLEGFLFPDTYFFSKKEKPREIIDRLLQRFSKELTSKTEARLDELNLSVLDWVTMASLVEREAAKEEERPVIAAVFNNRLKKGMLLQSCATVQYILKEVKPVLSLADLEIESPYNTYKHPGLPPGPIANPGHASLQAVLYPADTQYLYFVSKNDGSHAFAVTYSEHLKNVARYQR